MPKENKSFTIKVNGKMYVGDLCYAMSREDYDQYWGSHNYEDGAYDTPDGMFAMVGTAYGDGCYESDIDFAFPVDAGIIGICDGELVKKDVTGGMYGDLGIIVDAVDEATIVYDDGTIGIHYTTPTGEHEEIQIYTSDYDEDEDEDYEDEDYE